MCRHNLGYLLFITKVSTSNTALTDSCASQLVSQQRYQPDAAKTEKELFRQIDLSGIPPASVLQDQSTLNGINFRNSSAFETHSSANLKTVASPTICTSFESLLGEILPPVAQSISKRDLSLLILDLAKDQDLSIKERHRYVKALIRLLLKRGSLKPRESRDSSPPFEAKTAA